MRCLPAVTLLLVTALQTLAQAPCEHLASLKLAGVTITAAETIAAGAYKTQEPPNAIVSVPAFCRVAATLHPSADSRIGVEVWLPEDWNGKYEDFRRRMNGDPCERKESVGSNFEPGL